MASLEIRHAGDTLCDGLVSCKTPHHWRCGGRRKDVHPAGAPAITKKLAQHGPSTGLSAKKLSQQAQKHEIWGVLSAQGELIRAFAITQRRRANFFAPK